MVEAPAGLVGDAIPEARIKAEVEEEAGYRAAAVTKIFDAIMMPGCAGHRVHLFVAAYRPSDKVSAGGGMAVEGEDIEVIEVESDDALTMIESGETVDANTIMLLQHARSDIRQSHGRGGLMRRRCNRSARCCHLLCVPTLVGVPAACGDRTEGSVLSARRPTTLPIRRYP